MVTILLSLTTHLHHPAQRAITIFGSTSEAILCVIAHLETGPPAVTSYDGASGTTTSEGRAWKADPDTFGRVPEPNERNGRRRW